MSEDIGHREIPLDEGNGQPAGLDEAEEEQRRRRKGRRRLIILGMVMVLLLLLAAAMYYIQSQKPISTLPGVRAIARGTPPTYLFSIYGVNEPFGVAVSPDGNRVYVTESGGERQLKIFDREGRPIISVSPANSNPGSRSFVYATVDEAGNVYAVDRISGVIFSYDQDGRPVKQIVPSYDESTEKLKEEYSWTPLGIAPMRQGGFLVTNVTEGKHGILGIDFDGKVLWGFGKEGEEADQFEFPNQAISDGKGRIYVSNGNLRRVTVFEENGRLIGNFGTASSKEGVQLPRGMVIDDLDRLYVVDAFDHGVKVFDLAVSPPKFLFAFGKFGAMNGEFQYPNGIARDITGRLYVTDRDNNRVQVWGY